MLGPISTDEMPAMTGHLFRQIHYLHSTVLVFFFFFFACQKALGDRGIDLFILRQCCLYQRISSTNAYSAENATRPMNQLFLS